MDLAVFFNHDFENGSFKLYDKNGNVIFYESLYRCWIRYELDENGEITFWEVSDGDTFGIPKNKLN